MRGILLHNPNTFTTVYWLMLKELLWLSATRWGILYVGRVLYIFHSTARVGQWGLFYCLIRLLAVIPIQTDEAIMLSRGLVGGVWAMRWCVDHLHGAALIRLVFILYSMYTVRYVPRDWVRPIDWRMCKQSRVQNYSIIIINTCNNSNNTYLYGVCISFSGHSNLVL